MKLKKVNKNREQDWDFDFSIYEREEKEEATTTSIVKDNKPNITNLRSKYGASIETIQLLISIRTNLAEKAIAVAARTDDIKEIWDLYGCINEAWSLISDIYGKVIIKEVKALDELILSQILTAQKNSKIPEQLYKNLLTYRDKIYMLIQRANLGLEVEKKFGSHYNKAKTGIIQ